MKTFEIGVCRQYLPGFGVRWKHGNIYNKKKSPTIPLKKAMDLSSGDLPVPLTPAFGFFLMLCGLSLIGARSRSGTIDTRGQQTNTPTSGRSGTDGNRETERKPSGRPPKSSSSTLNRPLLTCWSSRSRWRSPFSSSLFLPPDAIPTPRQTVDRVPASTKFGAFLF